MLKTVFYRAAVELDIEHFNPDAFVSKPVWLASSYQLASLVFAAQDQTFRLGQETLHIQKGQSFNVVNSYKFPPSVFRDAAQQAGLRIEYLTTDISGMVLVLLRNNAEEQKGFGVAA